MAAEVQNGKTYSLRLKHGVWEREIRGKVRVFEDEYGETRYEVISKESTMGFLPENVIEAKP